MQINTVNIPEDIKPCPMCGGKVEVESIHIEFTGEETMCVECSECGTEFTVHGIKHEKIELGTIAEPAYQILAVGIPAIDKWNTRVK